MKRLMTVRLKNIKPLKQNFGSTVKRKTGAVVFYVEEKKSYNSVSSTSEIDFSINETKVNETSWNKFSVVL